MVEAPPERTVRAVVFVLMVVAALSLALAAVYLVAPGPWPWQLAKMWHAISQAGADPVPSG